MDDFILFLSIHASVPAAFWLTRWLDRQARMPIGLSFSPFMVLTFIWSLIAGVLLSGTDYLAFNYALMLGVLLNWWSSKAIWYRIVKIALSTCSMTWILLAARQHFEVTNLYEVAPYMHAIAKGFIFLIENQEMKMLIVWTWLFLPVTDRLLINLRGFFSNPEVRRLMLPLAAHTRYALTQLIVIAINPKTR